MLITSPCFKQASQGACPSRPWLWFDGGGLPAIPLWELLLHWRLAVVENLFLPLQVKPFSAFPWDAPRSPISVCTGESYDFISISAILCFVLNTVLFSILLPYILTGLVLWLQMDSTIHPFKTRVQDSTQCWQCWPLQDWQWLSTPWVPWR